MNKEVVKTPAWKSNASARRTRGLISNGLVALFEVYDDLPVTQHIMNILRPKKMDERKVVGEQVYHEFYMDDQAFLKAMESYTIELQKAKLEEEDDE